MDYLSVIACPEVLYSSYTTALKNKSVSKFSTNGKSPGRKTSWFLGNITSSVFCPINFNEYNNTIFIRALLVKSSNESSRTEQNIKA